MTLLTVVQQHCRIYNLNVPNAVVSSTDTTIRQIYGLCNDIVQNISDDSKWQSMGGIATWTLLAQEDQGDIFADIIGTAQGPLWVNPETFYDRTLMRPLYGPCTDVEWEALKAIPNPGPWYKFRILNNRLLINPIPSVSSGLSVIAFEYNNKFLIKATDGTRKEFFTIDSDTMVLPERLLQKGLAYRWKELKNLPFDREEKRYYDMLQAYISRDKPARSFRLDEPVNFDLQPGIFVPSGNWPTH